MLEPLEGAFVFIFSSSPGAGTASEASAMLCSAAIINLASIQGAPQATHTVHFHLTHPETILRSNSGLLASQGPSCVLGLLPPPPPSSLHLLCAHCGPAQGLSVFAGVNPLHPTATV